VSILCYHSVESHWTSPLALEPEVFARHCAWLARHRTVVPLADAVARMDHRGRLPRGLTALTFDDGFASLYDQVLPLLLRHRLPATVFLVAETLTPAGRAVDWVDTPPHWALSTLSVNQVLEMQSAGLDFQSHSYSHLDLTQLTHDECLRDLRASRAVLEEVLRRPVHQLAYPRGRHNDTVRAAARTAGYQHSFGLPEQREAVSADAIPRVGLHRGNGTGVLRVKDSPNYLRVRTSAGYARARRALRR
jgi:peptidoglycan/xylan/chitin deacetylase (PgdA/CDA1 family)